MRYGDEEDPGWDVEERAFAAAWRIKPKWEAVGPHATLVKDDIKGAIRELRAGRDGEIEVAGPGLANSLRQLGLIDEYRIYLHPVALGQGKPYFTGPQQPLRLKAHDLIGDDVVRLTCVPA